MAYDHAVMFYIISFLFLLLNFYFNRPAVQFFQTLFLGLALGANAIQIYVNWQHMGVLPVFALRDMLMLVSLSLGGLYAVFSLLYRRPYMGFFMLPMAIFAGLLSLFLTPPPVHSMALENVWLYLHIPLAIIGTAFYLTVFASGLMYFIMERQLKKKKFGRIFDRFPPLAVINKINNGSIYLGFAFYTVALIAAAGWVRLTLHDNTALETTGFSIKIVLACVAWVVFGGIMFVKRRFGMSPRNTALASVLGFLSVIATYTGVAIFIAR